MRFFGIIFFNRFQQFFFCKGYNKFEIKGGREEAKRKNEGKREKETRCPLAKQPGRTRIIPHGPA